MTELNPTKFVEKYKLIPKPMRFRLLEFVGQMPYTYDNEMIQEVFDDVFDILRWYENFCKVDNYTMLKGILEDDVYLGPCPVYSDVARSLLNCLTYSCFLPKNYLYTSIVKFRHANIMKQIKDEVAYRPGNPGYDRTRLHFESLVMLM